MARSSRQKEKLLYLQKIMLEKTDENHALTLNEIKELLGGYGILTERKSLYNDLQVLETFGMDICRTRDTTVRYFVGNRDFEIPELKLLVDAIQSSKFITHSKSLKLIKKLERLVSENDGKQLQREVYVTHRVKTLNEQIYYNVDELYSAISDNRQISFRYMKWAVDFSGRQKIVKVERHEEKIYTVSPFALCWDDENYYLVAYDSEAGATARRNLKNSILRITPKAFSRCSAARNARSSSALTMSSSELLSTGSGRTFTSSGRAKTASL